jgi:CBS domain-containing protein
LRLAKQLGRDRVISFAETCELSDTGADGLHDAFSRLTAADIMTPLVASLDQSMNLREATEFLLTLRLDSAPIIDRAGDLVGAVGEEDLAHALVGPDAWNRPVAEVMKKRPSCFATHTPVRVIHDFLSRVAARRVIILEGRRPVGIVSRASILRWREFHELAGRTVLTPLPDEDASPSAIQRSLLQAVAEVRQQADGLYRGLQTGENSPAEMAVAAATRIQHLLEETVVQSQRLNSRSPAVATISTMVV